MDPLERAVQELNEQNYGSAIRSLEMVTARDPSNADAHKHLSRAYYQTGRLEQAAESAQRYAALQPTDPAGHYNAGVLLAKLGQNEAALRAMRAALSADPGHAKARRALAKLEGLDETTGLPVQAPAAPAATPATRPQDDVRRPMPWPAKVAAILTILASIAILLWLFLPGGRLRPGPQRTDPENSPNALTSPPANQPSATDPDLARSPETTPTPQLQPNGTSDVPVPTPDASDQPLTDNRQPSTAAPGAQPRGLFTPQEAQRVTQEMNQAHQQDVAQARGEIGQIAQAIRNLDEETWREGGRDALILMTTQMLGTEASAGTLAALNMVATAETPAQAADRLEAYARSLPPALTPQQLFQLQAVLTRPNVTPQEAYAAIKGNFESWGIGLLDGPDRILRQYLQMAPGVGGGPSTLH